MRGGDFNLGLRQLVSQFTQHIAKRPLTKDRTKRKMTLYANDGQYLHNYAAADNPEALILGLPRKSELTVQQYGGDTHGHEPGVAHGTQMIKPVAKNHLATNTMDKRTQCKVAESQVDLPRGVAPYGTSVAGCGRRSEYVAWESVQEQSGRVRV